MAIIHRERGFVVHVWPADHRPPHVHVVYGDEEVLIEITGRDGKAEVYQVRGMRAPNIARAVRLVNENQEKCLRGWEKYHGS